MSVRVNYPLIDLQYLDCVVILVVVRFFPTYSTTLAGVSSFRAGTRLAYWCVKGDQKGPILRNGQPVQSFSDLLKPMPLTLVLETLVKL